MTTKAKRLACGACASWEVDSHCRSRTCTWWRCRRCTSYGDGRGRVADCRPKDMR